MIPDSKPKPGPLKTREAYLETLRNQGLPQTAERLRELLLHPKEASPR
jgi:hypothetical protein